MTKNSLVWRLPSKLTLDDIEKMLSLKIITPEEAKTLTFNQADDNERIKVLEEQVSFLKQLVDKLSSHGVVYGWNYVQSYTPRWGGWTTSGALGTTYANLCSTAGTTVTTAYNGAATGTIKQ